MPGVYQAGKASRVGSMRKNSHIIFHAHTLVFLEWLDTYAKQYTRYIQVVNY